MGQSELLCYWASSPDRWLQLRPATEKKEVIEIEKSIGIDIGKRKCVTCVMDADGTVLEESWYHNTSGSASEFAARAKAEYGTCKAVCESTGNHWVKTADAFESVGIPLELANPLKTKAIAWASIKNDTIDARTLAHLLRAGLVAGCYIGSAKTRGIKQVLRYEMSVVQDRTAVINFVHTLTDKYDIDPKSGGNMIWREKTLKYLDAAQLKDPSDQFVLDQCISRIRYYNGQIRKLDGEIARYVKSNYMPKLLLSMTGIDVFSAALLAAEIDDIARFGNPKRLVSWAGMCPTLHQSGDTSYHGRMKKDSNRKVNWIMIQCARVAVMHDDRMKAYYERLKKRNRPSVAITHVANKMLTIIWHMLTRNELYKERNENLYRAKIKKVMATR